MIIENTNIEPVPTDSGQDLFAMPVEQVEEIETINIEDHPIHGDFKVEVPKGWEDAQVKEYVGALDLDLLLGLPQREDDKDLGVTDVKKIKEFENAVGSGFREGRWYAHDSLEGGTQSIAFGRKLTKAEEKLGFINIDGKDVDYRQGITPKQAEALFVESTNSAKRVAMASLVKVGLEDDNSKVQALTSLVYNVGPSAWGKSKAKAFLEAGNVEDFLHEAFDSKVGFVRINGEISRGLVRRRGDEARLFASEDVVKEGGFGNMLRQALKAINPIGSAEAHSFINRDNTEPLPKPDWRDRPGVSVTKEGVLRIKVGPKHPDGKPPVPPPPAQFNTDTGVFDFFDAEPAQAVEPSGSSSIPEPTKIDLTANPDQTPGVDTVNAVTLGINEDALGLSMFADATTLQTLVKRNHTVKSGETLSSIATKFGTTVEELVDLNSNITDPDKIAVGQEILTSVLVEATPILGEIERPAQGDAFNPVVDRVNKARFGIPSEPVKGKQVGSTFLKALGVPTHVRSVFSHVLGTDVNELRDQDYFTLPEQSAAITVVGRAATRLGIDLTKPSLKWNRIDYDLDYIKGQTDVSGRTSNALLGDSEAVIKWTLGTFSWRIDSRGHLLIKDKYNFNDAKSLQSQYPSFLQKMGLLGGITGAVLIGKAGLYGIVRTGAALYGSTDGSGAEFTLDLGKIS
jgi:GH24 family phage-related lysozyme (muramidase)